jgi:iron complex transport system permease protein
MKVINTQLFTLLGVLFVLIVFIISITTGTVVISTSELFQLLFTNHTLPDLPTTILYEIRIPKSLSAVSAGIALSVSGYLLQTLFRNPLASPSSLGISSGASLGVAFVMIGSSVGISTVSTLSFLHSTSVIGAAIVGAFFTTMVVLLLSLKIRSMTTMLLVGFMVGTICTAIVGIWQYISSPDQLQAFFLWSMGSLHLANLNQSIIFLIITISITFVIFIFSKQITIVSLGEELSKSFGINVPRLRLMLLITCSILAGCVTAFCGPIGFVGIIVPHIVRYTIHSNDAKKIIPWVVICGASFLLICDIITSVLSHTFPLPISLITSIIGVPIVLWILMTKSFYSTVN